MKVHLFGAASSPGCANFGLKHLAAKGQGTGSRKARLGAGQVGSADPASSGEASGAHPGEDQARGRPRRCLLGRLHSLVTAAQRDRHLDPGTRLGAPARTRKAAGVVTPTSAGLLLCESVRGARVLDVARRLPSALKQRDDFGTVVLHVGAVDTFARRSEILKEHYRSLLDTARKKTSARLVVSGPLPTFRRGCESYSRLFCLHSWLRDTCSSAGVDYVDNWESFRERPSLYRRDGLHPSRLGSAVLSRNIEDVLRRA
ncbi:uncharacterized protein LOC143509610 [Brachyhypopomus gauderio]|uniref:uncharacterized protein LOC143509610 n=1 Tax=Brachyhypopomus gauderio TaxID=698409 RepID=UPI00404303DB